MFACGTAAVITPVGSVDGEHGGWTIGDGGPGPISMQLRERLVAVQTGARARHPRLDAPARLRSTASVDVGSLIDQLVADGPLLAVAADEAGLDAPVPGTEWDVRALVTHVGGIHRWAADIVRTARQQPGHRGRRRGRHRSRRRGTARLVPRRARGRWSTRCAARRPISSAAAFLPADSPLHFWARRQAHETAVHRADAQAAAGHVVPFAAPFAQDGIAEMLFGFARRKSQAASGDADDRVRRRRTGRRG